MPAGSRATRSERAGSATPTGSFLIPAGYGSTGCPNGEPCQHRVHTPGVTGHADGARRNVRKLGPLRRGLPGATIGRMTPLPTLRGPRILLRPVATDDRADLAAILAEPEVARWWAQSGVDYAVDDIYADWPHDAWAIELDGRLIGYIQVAEELDRDYRHASIDLFVATAFQGRGLGPEAIRLVARHLIDDRGHHRITIDPAVANERAIAAYAQIGFRPVGVMRRYERGPDGEWHDALLMDLLEGELT